MRLRSLDVGFFGFEGWGILGNFEALDVDLKEAKLWLRAWGFKFPASGRFQHVASSPKMRVLFWGSLKGSIRVSVRVLQR